MGDEIQELEHVMKNSEFSFGHEKFEEPIKHPWAEFKQAFGHMECKGTIWAGDINMEMYLSQKTGWFQTLLVLVSLDIYAYLATKTLSLQALSLPGFLCHMSSIFGPLIPSSLDSVLESSS